MKKLTTSLTVGVLAITAMASSPTANAATNNTTITVHNRGKPGPRTPSKSAPR